MDTYTNEITDDGLVMISRRTGCPHCSLMFSILKDSDLNPQIVYSDNIRSLFIKAHSTVPQLYYRGDLVGDAAALNVLYKVGGAEAVRKRVFDGPTEDGLF